MPQRLRSLQGCDADDRFQRLACGSPTLASLALITVIGMGLRVVLMMTVQERRQRQNRQINERLKVLIAAYKTLGGSFTGDLTVSPQHMRDVRRAERQREGDETSSGERGLAAAETATASNTMNWRRKRRLFTDDENRGRAFGGPVWLEASSRPAAGHVVGLYRDPSLPGFGALCRTNRLLCLVWLRAAPHENDFVPQPCCFLEIKGMRSSPHPFVQGLDRVGHRPVNVSLGFWISRGRPVFAEVRATRSLFDTCPARPSELADS